MTWESLELGSRRTIVCGAACAVLAACAADAADGGEPQTSTRQALVAVAGGAPQGPALPAGHTIPGLTDELGNGAVTNLDALGQPPPADDLNAWADRAADPQLTPPAFHDRLHDAISSIDTGFVLGDKTHNFAYEPERGRWLAGSTPAAMDEIRERGARLYCAAKQAYQQRVNSTTPMGKWSLASFSILGGRVEFMTAEPNVALGAPKKFATNDSDGGQAFSIPIKVGTKFTPVSFLPFLSTDEDQYVYFTTADGSSVNELGPGGAPVQTATHADAFTGFTGEFSTGLRFPLFTFAFGSVDLDVKYNWGQAACAQSDTYEDCQSSPQLPIRRLLDSGASDYPGRRRGGPTAPPALLVDGTQSDWGIVNDGPWSRANAGFAIDPLIGVVPLSSPQPMFLRANQNNDKSIDVQTGIGLSAGAALDVGAKWGPFDLAVEFSVELTSNMYTTHRIREQLNGIEYDVMSTPEFATIEAIPVTDLSVTPNLSGDFGLQMNLTLHLGLNLPIVGHIGFDRTLLSAGSSVPVAGQDAGSSGWPEANRLRISSALSWDGSLSTNGLVSHWPLSDTFVAQPDTLEQCLSGAAPPSLPGNGFPPPCAVPAMPGASPVGIQANICFVTALPYPDDSRNTACDASKLQFASAGRTQTRVFRGLDTAVRVLDDAALNDLSQIMSACANELQNADSVKAMFESGFVMCDGNGVPFDTADVVQQLPAPPPTAIQPPSSCQ